MEEDLLKKLVNNLGINGPVNEALARGDLQTLISSMLSGQNSDPLLAIVMQFLFGQNHQNHAVPSGTPSGTADRDASHYGSSDVAVLGSSDNGQLAAGATLRYVTRMLGACPTCCGEEASCPECHGTGKPGSVPSIASAEEFRAWIEPALGSMGMHVTNPDQSMPLPK
jgi:hypothetical protein